MKRTIIISSKAQSFGLNSSKCTENDPIWSIVEEYNVVQIQKDCIK